MVEVAIVVVVTNITTIMMTIEPVVASVAPGPRADLSDTIFGRFPFPLCRNPRKRVPDLQNEGGLGSSPRSPSNCTLDWLVPPRSTDNEFRHSVCLEQVRLEP